MAYPSTDAPSRVQAFTSPPSFTSSPPWFTSLPPWDPFWHFPGMSSCYCPVLVYVITALVYLITALVYHVTALGCLNVIER
ncbi:UNVERIFIED_CONTAM: hypothetical protein FKN15_067654 [Acipenser sinensis]